MSLFTKSRIEKKCQVLLISMLPLPWGGVSALTEILMRRGLPEPYRLKLINTTIHPRKLFEPTPINLSEVLRLVRILGQVLYSLVFDKIELVHFNFTPSRVSLPRDYFITLFSKIFTIPIVTQIHGDISKYDVSGWFGMRSWFLKRILGMSSGVIVINDDSFEWVTDTISHSQMINLPNFVELPEEAQIRRYLSNDDFLKVLFVGGLAPAKGVWDILEAAMKTQRIKFILVGEPITGIQPELEKFIAENNLVGCVELLGVKANDDVQRLMSECDVYCLPSYNEGVPVSILEAMAWGMPVVASSVGGIPEIIDDQQGGYLITPGDCAHLVGTLEYLRDHSDIRLQMGNYNRQKIRCKYEYSIVIEQLIDFYKTLMAKRGNNF